MEFTTDDDASVNRPVADSDEIEKLNQSEGGCGLMCPGSPSIGLCRVDSGTSSSGHVSEELVQLCSNHISQTHKHQNQCEMYLGLASDYPT
jgi:hypothetical protein